MSLVRRSLKVSSPSLLRLVKFIMRLNMDTIDNFYLLCALYDDKIDDVIKALKKAGARDRPYRIEINIENLYLEKYKPCIEKAIFQLSEEY